MLTIDAQVHAYERNHSARPWADVLHGPPEVTGDDMVTAMAVSMNFGPLVLTNSGPPSGVQSAEPG